MEKKRKRAAFTPPKPSKSSKSAQVDIAESETKEMPKRVVEVIVEDRLSKENPVPTQVNIVLPKEEKKSTDPVVEELEDEESNMGVDPAELASVREQETPEESTEDEITAPSEDEEETLEAVASVDLDEEVVATGSQPVVTDLSAQDKAQQKETVEELFGNNSSTVLPEITVHKKSATKGLFIWLITMITIALGVGGGLIMFSRFTPAGTTVTPTPTPMVTSAPTVTPSPTPEPLSREDINIEVINGGGVAGAGSRARTFLTDKGYTVGAVGNADEYTFEETEISVKASKAGILSTLRTDLEENYTVGSTDTTLPETSEYDAVVTLGK